MEAWHIFALIIVLAYTPGLFWLWYFVKKDLEPEPLHLIRNCFLLGMLSVIPAGLIEGMLPLPKVLQTVLGAPIIEESCKFLTVYFTIYGSAEFDEPMDGVVYSVAVALGFASLENAFYLYKTYHDTEGSLPTVTVIRGFFSVPGHALFAVMWGYPLGIAKFSSRALDRNLVAVGLILGMVFHGIFNGPDAARSHLARGDADSRGDHVAGDPPQDRRGAAHISPRGLRQIQAQAPGDKARGDHGGAGRVVSKPSDCRSSPFLTMFPHRTLRSGQERQVFCAGKAFSRSPMAGYVGCSCLHQSVDAPGALPGFRAAPYSGWCVNLPVQKEEPWQVLPKEHRQVMLGPDITGFSTISIHWS